jgi:predicted hotdog family 3-hydroxylacyl-ACP dehydratase
MNLTDVSEFLPHRDRMKLIDRILRVDETQAVTESIVTENWPLVEADSVQSIIIVELVAQTASVHVTWKEKQNPAAADSGRGWLVGIKQARFLRDRIPVGGRIRTRAWTVFHFDNYTGIQGKAEVDTELIGDVELQVMRSDTGSVLAGDQSR